MQITGQKLIGHRRGSFRLRSTKTVCLCVKAFSLRLTRVQNYLIANWLSNTPKLMSRCMTALGAKRSLATIVNWLARRVAELPEKPPLFPSAIAIA
jgi:hypothetical protein